MELIHPPAKISRAALQAAATQLFGNLVKAVVDIEKGVMVINAELHADEEAYLIEHGSLQQNLWGINLYPELEGDDFIEFDSMINLRPSQGNTSRSVENPVTQDKIRRIVAQLVEAA